MLKVLSPDEAQGRHGYDAFRNSALNEHPKLATKSRMRGYRMNVPLRKTELAL